MKLSPKASIATIAAAGFLAVTLTSCSQSNTGTSQSTAPSTNTQSSSSAPATTPSAAPTPVAAVPDVKGVHTQVILDQGFLDAITSLKLTPSAYGDAKLGKISDPDGTGFTFPITGGNVKYYDPADRAQLPDGYVQGELDHNGSGINLKAGDTTVSLRNFVVIPNSDSKVNGDVYVNGKKAATGVEIFRLDGSTLNPLAQDDDGNAVLEGTTVYVSDTAAKLLNDTFGTDAVTGDLKVGVAKITLSTK